jgi:hypothetical protein
VDGFAPCRRCRKLRRVRRQDVLGLASVRGHFDRFDGGYEIGPDGTTIELTIDADSLGTGNSMRDKHLRSADFFGVAEHPDVRFTSTRVHCRKPRTVEPKTAYQAEGEGFDPSSDPRARNGFRDLPETACPQAIGDQCATTRARANSFVCECTRYWYHPDFVDDWNLRGVRALRAEQRSQR